MPTLIQGKLSPGLVPDFTVDRPRLRAVLDEAWNRPVTLVAAPAGYGKSTLLAQWAAGPGRGRAAWLTVDDRDVDPVRFGSHLLAALGQVCPAVGTRSERVLGSVAEAPGAEFVDLLVEELQTLDEDVVLVLEDLDRLADSPVTQDLARLVRDLPRRLHLVLAARADPNVGLHRLRARDELAEVRAAELRFDSVEVAQVIAGLSGHELGDDEARHLTEVTEGWPVAVQLAAISLRSSDAGASVFAFDGSDRNIVDYLSAELLDRAPEHLRSFLMDVSVLETMNAELCDAVTGRDDGARMLADLTRRSLFVTAVPGESGWWRQHRLVREFLLGDLRAEAPRRAAQLRRRAADWYLTQDDPGQAAGYLVDAEAWDELLELIDEHGKSMWDQGHAATLHQLVESIPAGVLRGSTRSQLIAASVRLVAGRAEAGAATLGELDQRDLTPGEGALVAVLQASLVLDVNPVPADIGRADDALVSLAALSAADLPIVLGSTSLEDATLLLECSTALARFLLGDGSAVDHVSRALGGPQSTRTTFRVNAHGIQALFDALRWRPGSATAHSSHALDIATRRLGPDHVATVFALSARGVAARMANDLEAASELTAAAIELAERWSRWPIASFLLAEAAMLALASGAPDLAAAQVQRARRLPLAPMVEGRLRAVDLRVGIARDDPATAWRQLDPVSVASSWELAFAVVTAAARSDDPGLARKYLDLWPAACAPLGERERELATVLVEDAEGDTAAAHARLTSLLARTEPEGVVRPYLDAGEPLTRLLQDDVADRPRVHVDAILRAARQERRGAAELVDPLSARELEVLAQLPTRLSNAQIAEVLYVSTNTVKTHIKHIYQKLSATDRDDAVRRAEELGLL